MTLLSEGRTLSGSVEDLRQAFEEVRKFVATISATTPGLALVSFEQPISPRMSRVEGMVVGKERQFQLTFAVSCPLPAEGGRLEIR